MPAEPKLIIPGARYQVASAAGASITAGASPQSEVLHHLSNGTIVLSAEVRQADDHTARVRISSPGGWLDAADLVPTAPAPRLSLDIESFAERYMTVARGDRYGLEFPFTLDMIGEFGIAFLTDAFRAAGTISADNSVTEIIELKPLGHVGASENAFLTVAYAKEEPGLHNDLFVKVPPAEMHFRHRLLFISSSEAEMYIFSQERTLPLKVPRYYFGDFSSYTGNSILITQRVSFGVSPVEQAYRKGYDQYVPNVEEHYRVLARSLGQLASAHKNGALGYEIERVFPYAHAARDFDPLPGHEGRINKLVDFVGRIAPQLFPQPASDPVFLQRWKKDLLFGYEHKDTVIAYLHSKVDYTALCHPNLNIDNAWFWRDEAGELHAGLLDWGGAGQMSIAQALSGMLMMPDPTLYLSLVDDVMTTFLDEYGRGCGIILNRDELHMQYKASLFSTAMWTIIDLIVPYLSNFSESDFKEMRDRFDERLQNSGLSAAIIWIDNMLREWLTELTPGDAWRWIAAEGQVLI